MVQYRCLTIIALIFVFFIHAQGMLPHEQGGNSPNPQPHHQLQGPLRRSKSLPILTRTDPPVEHAAETEEFDPDTLLYSPGDHRHPQNRHVVPGHRTSLSANSSPITQLDLPSYGEFIDMIPEAKLASVSTDTNLAASSRRVEKHREGAKIFVLAPNSWRSHFNLFLRLVEILLEQEWVQHIHMLVPELTSHNRQPTDPYTRGKLVVQYFNPRERQGGKLRRMSSSGKEWNQRDHQTDINSNSGANLKLLLELAEDTALITNLAEKEFDFGIAELWDYGALHILWLLGVKHFVATQNMPLESIHYHYLGYLRKIIHQGDIPELWTAKYNDHRAQPYSTEFTHNFLSKVSVLRLEHSKMLYMYEQAIYDKYAGIINTVVPEYSQLFADIRCIFVNTQPFLDFEMPPIYPPKVVHIGGILLDQQQQHGELQQSMASSSDSASSSTPDDKELKAIKASHSKSKQGLIVVNFGTVVNMEKMPEEAFDNFLELFAAFPQYVFLWKFESPKLAHYYKLKNHKNVHVKAWLNQIAILANPQTKLFISHCGINSVIEAVHYAVPLLCVPFLADQFYTSEALARRNVAIVVDKDNLGGLVDKMKDTLTFSSIFKNHMVQMQKDLAESWPHKTFIDAMNSIWKND